MPESDLPETNLNDLAAEAYERGLALRKAGLFKQAIEQFEKATSDPALALKAYAQIGLSKKSCDRYDEAVTAFRNALKSPGATTKETVQILYVLGRTLESLGRIAEALEAYRWLRREDSLFRDVGERIDALSKGRSQAEQRSAQNNPMTGTSQQLHAWQNLLRNVK
jgi:tetratricopeptide (TPR) repeat protein